MDMDTLEALYIDELKDLWSAEKQILKALPKMAKAAVSDTVEARIPAVTTSSRLGSTSGAWSGSSSRSMPVRAARSVSAWKGC